MIEETSHSQLKSQLERILPEWRSKVAPDATAPRVRVPIRLKITFPYFLLALLLALGGAYLVTQIVIDSIQERFTNQLIEGGKLAAEWMVREEDRLLKTYRLLAYTQDLPEALQAGDAERLRELGYGIAVNNREESVIFIDGNGETILSMFHRRGGAIEEYQFSRGGAAPWQDAAFVDRALSGELDLRGDKFAGIVWSGEERVFYVAGPVFDGQRAVVGAILVGKSLPTLARQIREETLGQVTLYDDAGQPLASTFAKPEELAPDLAAEVRARGDEGSFQRGVQLQRGLSVSNIDYSEILGPWMARGESELGLMGISLPKAFLVHTSQVTRMKVFLLVAGALALVIYMGMNIANLITRPLIGLVTASTEIARGNLDVQVTPQSQDEVEVLAESFNTMVANLQRSKMELLEAYNTTIEGWSKALDLRDKETEGHSQRVTELTLRLAQEMGISEAELVHVRRGALLHDIGKMGIPDGILLKEGSLTDEEWEIMRRHPVYSNEMLWPIEYLRPALDIPYCHHERWDGTGYPRGLKGEEIPLPARIFAVVDVWDAMRSDRPYRPALSKEETQEHIRQGSGSHFDPQVVDRFIQMMGDSDD